MNKNIKNFVFDLGGVLIDWNPRYYFRNYFLDDEEMEFFLREICDPVWNLSIDAGKPFEQAVRERQQLHPEYSDAIEMYWRHWSDMLGGVLDSTVELLKELKGKGFRLLALTNWSAETFPVALERYDFLQLFEGIVVSGEVKMVKPGKEIFGLLVEKYGIEPMESVFIDDSRPNVETAASLGFNAVRFDNIDNVRAAVNAIIG